MSETTTGGEDGRRCGALRTRGPGRARWSIPWLAGLLLALGSFGCPDPDEAIFAWLDEAGEEPFRRRRQVATPRWTCHDFAGDVKKVGPSLLGVFGRRAGWAPNYKPSQALLDSQIVWNERTLSAFLSDPAGFVPGNTMVSPGVQDPQAIADLLFYMRHVTRPGAREMEPPS
jgi:cytochrome c2